MANAAEITDATFEAEVVQSDKPVLVDFWAPWCAPCRTVGAVLDQLSGERDDLKIVKINIDENPRTPSQYGVRGIPTLMLFKGGQVASTKVGAAPKGQLQSWIEQSIS